MQDCIFCKIVKKEIPGQIVYEDDQVLAFNDINPLAPVHILIIPKKHMTNLLDMEEGDKELFGHIHYVAQQIAKEKGLDETGFRLVSNHGADAGQVVFHIHFHLVGGKPLKIFV